MSINAVSKKLFYGQVLKIFEALIIKQAHNFIYQRSYATNVI